MTEKEDSTQHQHQTNKEWKFPGFVLPTTTPVPDQFFDELLPKLSGAEVKVLLYICRRTFGFKKSSDNISLNQLVGGIRTKDGRTLDRGTRLGKASVARALKSLAEKNIIRRTRRRSRTRGDEATSYALHFLPPVSQNETPPVSKRNTGVSHPRDTQQTGLQQTDRQQQVVVERMTKSGIDQTKARELAVRFSPARIEEKTELLEWKLELQARGNTRGRPIEDPAGWLIRAIEKDFQLPPGFKTSAQKEQEAARRKKETIHLARQQARREQHQHRQKEQERVQQAQRLAELKKEHGSGNREHELWEGIIGELETKDNGSNKAAVRSMLANSALLGVTDGEAHIVLRNQFVVDWVEKRLARSIQEHLHRRLGSHQLSIKFIALDRTQEPGTSST
jgi:phage replication O-like protein O